MPTGTKIDDGHPTTISFANFPNVAFWEKTVTPPGGDGGGPNDTTTMRNLVWRTRAPKLLKTLTACSGTAAYDPVVYDDIPDMINVNQLITVLFPNGDSVAFYGWLNELRFNEIREGEQPTLNFTIEPSNQDASGAEVGPTYTSGTTTTTTTT